MNYNGKAVKNIHRVAKKLKEFSEHLEATGNMYLSGELNGLSICLTENMEWITSGYCPKRYREPGHIYKDDPIVPLLGYGTIPRNDNPNLCDVGYKAL